MRRAIKLEVLGDPYINPTPEQAVALNNRFNEIVYGKDPSGIRINSTSFWDIASKNFVAEAEGNFRIIAPKQLEELSVFVQSELPALLDNPKIGTIDGLSRSDLLALKNSHGLDAVKQLITSNSLTQAIYTGLSATHVDAYLAATPDQLNALANDQAKLKAMQDYLTTLTDEERAYLKAGQAVAHDVTKVGSTAGTLFKKALGPVGVLLGLSLAAWEAGAAETAGRHDEAKEIMTRWAVDAAGSEIAQLAAGAIAGLGAAALVAAGAIPAAVAGAIVLGAALVGGFFGGDGATQLYELTKDKDENGRRDIIDKLSNLFFGATSIITTPLPADLNGGDRFTIDATFSREEIVARAKTDIAWRYALRELNPFVVTDIAYDRHNTDGSLDLYDPATGQGTMTDLYLQDRAAMLTWKIRYDNGDLDDNDSPHSGPKPYNENWDTSAVEGNWDFVDHTQHLPGGAPLTLAIDGNGISLYDHQIVFGSKGDDTLGGSGDSDHLYGMAGNDTLDGKGGDDYLEGNAGDDLLDGGGDRDTLIGGAGNDTLIGGAGTDRYVVNGNDIIRDADGSYVFLLDPTIGVSKDANLTLSLTDGSHIVIENFQSGQLGLSIAHRATGDATTLTLSGDLAPADADPETSGVQFGYDALGNVIVSGEAQPGRNDVLYDSAGADLILGLAGDDNIYAVSGGDDRIEGGEGNDYIEGGAGADLVIGGEGLYDTISGGAGNDRLYADELVDLDTAIAQGNTGPGTGGREVVSGGLGDDIVIGGTGDDFLYGGGGVDVIVGGAGYDTIDAGDDADLVFGGAGRDMITAGSGADLVQGGAEGDIVNGGAGDDRLYADEVVDEQVAIARGDTEQGTGNQGDWLAGGAGDDTVVGSTANDVLTGGGGNDLLIGGAGDDDILGDHDWVAWNFDWTVVDLPSDRRFSPVYGSAAPPDAGSDVIYAGQGNDHAWGDLGDDVIFGEGGNDMLMGGAGNDILLGGEGADTLFGDDDNDYLAGGMGDDTLVGGAGEDTLIGGEGSDTLQGGDGRDTYLINRGEGSDVIQDTKAENNIIRFGEGVNSADITLRLGSLMLDLGNGDAVHIADFDQTDALNSSTIDGFEFADGTVLSTRDLLARGFDLDGTAGDDVIVGRGMGGNDQLFGNAGDDLLDGGEGNDNVSGEAGDDEVFGGAGADRLFGLADNDSLSGGDVIYAGAGDDYIWGDAGDPGDAGGVDCIELADGRRFDAVELIGRTLQENQTRSVATVLGGGRCADRDRIRFEEAANESEFRRNARRLASR